jgi:hypothetical protein
MIPRVWMGVNKNLRQADRQQYATPLARPSSAASNVIGEKVGVSTANWHAAQAQASH